MSPSDRTLLGKTILVDLALREVLEAANSPADFVYFIESGFASVVADGGEPIEIGMIGREGVTGIAILLGAEQAPFETFVQGAGKAFKVSARKLKRATDRSPTLKALMLRYAGSFFAQVASTAAANGRATIEQRLSRWLLMVEDRMGSTFPITHEFLGIMLSVQRPGVTLALQALSAAHLVNATRGNIEIVDRDGLITNTRGAYGLAEADYLRLFPMM